MFKLLLAKLMMLTAFYAYESYMVVNTKPADKPQPAPTAPRKCYFTPEGIRRCPYDLGIR